MNTRAIKHKSEPRVVGAPLDTDPRFMRGEWLTQRLGWGFVALLVLAGLLGVFGDGPLARAEVAGPTALIEFDRFTRRASDSEWKITPTAASADGKMSVMVSAAFAQSFEIKDVLPPPASARLESDRWRYEFDATRLAGAPIVFHIRAQHAGRHTGEIQVGAAAPLLVSQLVYP